MGSASLRSHGKKFSKFLSNLKKAATPAYVNRSSEFLETFPFGKLPVQIQHVLSTSGKSKASIEEISALMQRQFQYQQFFPKATIRHHLNGMSSNTEKQPRHR